jgi:hypothetical protein
MSVLFTVNYVTYNSNYVKLFDDFRHIFVEILIAVLLVSD